MSDPQPDNLEPSPGETPDPSLSIVDTPADKTPDAPQTWPDDWRQQMAGEEDKYLKQLERFNSPADIFKSFREAQTKLSSQKPAVEKPGEDATEDQLKAYRESLGVPEKPEDYSLDFEDGTVIGEDIKPKLDGFLQYAHETNLPPETVKSTVGWFIKDVEAHKEAVANANDEARVNGISDLKSEWGGEFQGNMNAIHALFTSAPEGTMESLLESAGEDGLKFANNADNIRWLVGLAKQLNPTATLVPPGPDQDASVDAEIDKIHKLMNSPEKSERDKYWGDEKMQARYLQLNQAKQNR